LAGCGLPAWSSRHTLYRLRRLFQGHRGVRLSSLPGSEHLSGDPTGYPGPARDRL